MAYARRSIGANVALANNVPTNPPRSKRNSLGAPVHSVKNISLLNQADKENITEVPLKSVIEQPAKSPAKKRQSTGRRVSFAGAVAVRKFFTHQDGSDSQVAPTVMKPLPPDEHDISVPATPVQAVQKPAAPPSPALAASPHDAIENFSLTMLSPAATSPSRPSASDFAAALRAAKQPAPISPGANTSVAQNFSTMEMTQAYGNGIVDQRRASTSPSINSTTNTEKDRSVSLQVPTEEIQFNNLSLQQLLTASPAASKHNALTGAADHTEVEFANGPASPSLADLLGDGKADATGLSMIEDHTTNTMDMARLLANAQANLTSAANQSMDMTSAYGGILTARKADESTMQMTAAVGGILPPAQQSIAQADLSMDFTQPTGRIIAAAAEASREETMNFTTAVGGILSAANTSVAAPAQAAFEESVAADRTMDMTTAVGRGILAAKAADASIAMDMTGAVGGILASNRSVAADESLAAITPDPTMDLTTGVTGGILAANTSVAAVTPDPTMEFTKPAGGILAVTKPTEAVIEETTGNQTMDMTSAVGRGILQANQSALNQDDNTNTAPIAANVTAARVAEQSMEYTSAVGGIVQAQNISISTPGRNQSVDAGLAANTSVAGNTPGRQVQGNLSEILPRAGILFHQPVAATLRASTSQSIVNSTASLIENPLAILDAARAEQWERISQNLKEKGIDVSNGCTELETELNKDLPSLLVDFARGDANKAMLLRLQVPLQALKAFARKLAKKNFLEWRVMGVEQSRLALLNTFLTQFRTDEKTIRAHTSDLYRLRVALADDSAALQNRMEAAARADPQGMEKVREETQLKRALLGSLQGLHSWRIRSLDGSQLVVEFPMRASLTVRLGAALSETSRAIDEATLQLAPELATDESDRLIGVLLAGAQLGSQLNPNLLKSTDGLPHALRQISLVVGRAEKLAYEVRDLQAGHLVRVERITAGSVILAGSFASRVSDRACNAFEVEFELDAHYPHSQIQASYRHIFGSCSQQHVDAIVPKYSSFGRLTKMFNELLHVARTATS